ncbi:YdbH domain-containing protein [Coraliomargarita algicola]|uniref:YdbH domain-containing protein n=1 Tax=Coraliomargarita algicola TaxID=3092156 RepID=A0ABZ0RGG3_9BACT|nr:YdbH domain-containing protein [Coraliomargarita sp. J2-16]WPJ94647.1 YdbH domain-containing protein [Coraliomargarita sp. J2-16]
MRAFCLAGVFVMVGLGVLYFKSAAIFEAIVLPRLEARGGQLELESLRLSLSGAELQVTHYQEANLRVEGLRLFCPWSQVWSLAEGYVGSVYVDAVHIRLSEDTAVEKAGGGDSVDQVGDRSSLAGKVAEWATLIDGLPVLALDVTIADWMLVAGGQSLHGDLELSLLRGMGEATHIAAHLKSRGLELDSRLKVLAGGEGLSLDFTLSGQDWDHFQADYLQAISSQWTQAGGELYVNSMGDGRGFLDASGYARWLRVAPEQLSYSVLADLGAVEIYAPTGELILQQMAAGLARDRAGRVRSYAKGDIDSVRVGSWMETGGEWAVRQDHAALAGELRIGKSISLSVAHEDWAQLRQGNGRGRFYLEASSVDAELLRAFDLAGVPDDLTVDLELRAEGEGVFAAWQLVSAQIEVDTLVREAALTTTGVSLENARAQVDLEVSDARLQSGLLELNIELLDVLGFGFDQLNLEMRTDEDALLALQPVHVGFLGGELFIDAMEIDPSELEGLSFRIGLKEIDLAQLATAVPQFKGEVSGKLSGHLVGVFKEGQPVLTDGRLDVDPEQGARLRYDVTGLLTRGMAEGSPSYKQYRMAERAFEDLALKRFSIDVFPDDNPTRPFRLELFGESLQGNTMVPVDFSLNVNVDDTAGVLELLRMIQRGELEF